ncbi:MAG: SPOR domain-containing protein [Gammaproteobacteria bacterium]|nr:SPOR domain-containing protein [Gammaproteobacteria bacterium]
MEAHLQQRIVGAIVLVTLGVIFIPALLDGSGYRSRQAQDIRVKEKPEFPPLSQKEVKPIATPLETIKQNQAEARKSDAEDHQKKTIKSFALQVGTFDSNENAEKLRDELRKAGYTTFIVKTESNGKTSYKVRIGPELEYSVLEKIKTDIRKSHKIDAYIVNHP